MKERIKTITFGDWRVDIYLNEITGLYTASAENNSSGEFRQHIDCGTNYHGIWEALSEQLGASEVTDGADILALAQDIYEKLPDICMPETMTCMIDEHLRMQPEIYPAYVPEDIEYVLRRRVALYGKELHKLPAKCTLEDWIENVLATKRIYRITNNTYTSQPVEFTNAYATNQDWMMEFRLFCEADGMLLPTSITAMSLMSQMRLKHDEMDDLPTEYTAEDDE